MEHRVIWVHGIGDPAAGYSVAWREQFNRYLRLPDESFIEVFWRSILDASTKRGDAQAVVLTPAEEQQASDLNRTLEEALLARAARLNEDGASQLPVVDVEPQRVTRGLSPMHRMRLALNAGAYASDFARYLASGSVRDAVKVPLREALLPLAGFDGRVALVTHSWGTVLTHDTLVDLAQELPTLKVATVITMGSPLWLVRPYLEQDTGSKPTNVGTWVNIHARGDLVGSWLEPSFAVDRDYAVATPHGISAHTSYFADGNKAVQRDLVAQFIVGPEDSI